MTSPAWMYPCNSMPITDKKFICNLPLIWLTAQITNRNPLHSKTPNQTVQTSGSCYMSKGYPNDPYYSTCLTKLPQSCNSLKCTDSSSQLAPDCSCSGINCPSCKTTLLNTNYNYSYYDYTCTRGCYGYDGPSSCPGGEFLNFYPTKYADGSFTTNTLCQYTYNGSLGQPWSLNASPSNFPIDQFVKPIVQRYAILLFLKAWTNALYQDPTSKSIFHTSDYLSDPMYDSLIRQTIYAQSGASSYSNYFPSTSKIPASSFATFIQKTASYPQLVYVSPTTSKVILYLYNTDPIVNPNLTSTDTTSHIQSFTLESYPQLSAPTSSFDQNNPPKDLLTNKYYIIVNLTTQKIYNNNITDESQLVSINDLVKQNICCDYYVVGRVYPTTIVKWSPNLIYLFSERYKGSFPYDTIGQNGLCDRLIKDTNTVPYPCYLNTCSKNFSTECKTLVETFCPESTLYQTNFIGIQSNAEDYFLQGGSAICSCYNSPLMPPLITPPSPAAMCFTQQCTVNEALIDAYGLTDSSCKKYCPIITNWLANPDVNNRSIQPESIDPARYQRLCGSVIPAFSPINYYILIIGVIITALSTIATYFLTKRIWVVILISVLLLSLTLFLSYDLNGFPKCQGNTMGCRSRITHIPIPAKWCAFNIGCECVNLGEPCPDNKGICLGGICVSQKS